MAAAVILGVTVVVSLLGLWAAPRIIERNLFRPFWFLPRRQYWTAITSGFIHADLGHLLFNSLTYWFFAFPLERVIGSARFVALYFIGLVASNTGTYFKHRRDPITPAWVRQARYWRCCSPRSSTFRANRS
jgi:membrane associated rhomboid family serine protease